MRKASVNFKHYHVTLSEDIRAVATAAFAGPLPLGGLPQADVVNMDEFVFHDEALAQGERFYLKQPQKGSIVSVKKGNRGRKALAKKKKVAATRCGKGELNPRIFAANPKTLLQSRLVLIAVAWTH